MRVETVQRYIARARAVTTSKIAAPREAAAIDHCRAVIADARVLDRESTEHLRTEA